MAFDPGAPVGNAGLTQFDALVIGSGAGGGAITHILAKSGLKVLVLEGGPNWFSGLDDANNQPVAMYSNDELKFTIRNFIAPKILVDPRTYIDAGSGTKYFGDVNGLPKTVGGGAVHADLKMPRLLPTDFQEGSFANTFPGTNFADWPVQYDQLEPYYTYAEKIVGIQGLAGAIPGEGMRSAPFPMPPGVEMYASKVLSVGLQKLGFTPFPYPSAVTSQPYDGRPPCNDCGPCSDYGCPSNAKGSPPVTTLRKALLTGNCQLLPQRKVTKLLVNSTGTAITGVQAIGPDGSTATYAADRYILAASPIEDARLLLLSGNGTAIGNSSGQAGANLMFHRQTVCVGIFPQRIHGHRGRAVTTGFVDFRGNPADMTNHPMGGIVELSGSTGVIADATNMAQLLTLAELVTGTLIYDGVLLKNLVRQSPLRDHIASMTMHGEDAPQITNKVALDPDIKDLDGLPVSQITFQNSAAYEEASSAFYAPKMVQIMGAAGAQWAGNPLKNTPSQSAHVMGTLRFGTSKTSSVCNSTGQFWDIGNLWAADGSLFPTSSGFNPTMTIITLAMFVGANIVNPTSPLSVLQ
jgi:choline dehydrogenase-like flavoprotein